MKWLIIIVLALVVINLLNERGAKKTTESATDPGNQNDASTGNSNQVTPDKLFNDVLDLTKSLFQIATGSKTVNTQN